MKLFGYIRGDKKLHSLEEITVQADSARIRSLAAFFSKAADLMDAHGDKFGHEHYRDSVGNPPKDTDVIVVRLNKTLVT